MSHRATGSAFLLELEASCTLGEAAALQCSLVAANGNPLIVDGSAVERTDTAGLQLLAALARRQRTLGRALEWKAVSAQLRQCSQRLGLQHELGLPAESGGAVGSPGMDPFHEAFFEESLESIDAMEAALLRLSPGIADSQIIHTIFRTAHSIKGGAGMFGFNEITSFTHTMETLLDELRSTKLQVTVTMCDVLLQSVDVLRAMMAARRSQQPLDPEISRGLQQDFQRMIAGEGQPLEATLWHIGFKALPGLLSHGHDPLRIFDDLAGMGTLVVRVDVSALPALESIDPAHCHLRWQLELTSTAPRSAIELIFEWAQGDCELSIERAAGARVAARAAIAPVPVAMAQPSTMAAKPATAQLHSIRVAIGKIDGLLHNVGEIAMTQSLLGQIARDLQGVDAGRLRSGLAQMQAQVDALHEAVMRMRMLPVGSVFSRFPRLVRDLSTRLGKPIRLQLSGEQTELDKAVVEKIGDPLVHLVRNSVDHGIEPPAERLAAGKPPEGTVHLSAFHEDGAIRIVVSDDGRGLDAQRLIENARSKGVIEPDAVLTDEQAHDLIFMPGFSTADQATDLSGRGVGMDVVRRNIQELGGHVELSSEPGKGTTTTITLPLQMSPRTRTLMRKTGT